MRQDYTEYLKDKESGVEFAEAKCYNHVQRCLVKVDLPVNWFQFYGASSVVENRRWTSVDPLTASATIRNPQTFNRYSYVENSPISFKDPTGLFSNESVSAMARSRLEICWELGICGRAKLALEQRNARLESRSVCVAEEMGANAQAGSGFNFECLKNSVRECENSAREYFNSNVVFNLVKDTLDLPGSGFIFAYEVIKNLTIRGFAVTLRNISWAVAKAVASKIFIIVTVGNLIYSLYDTTQQAVAIENECRRHISDKCGKGCKSFLPNVGRA